MTEHGQASMHGIREGAEESFICEYSGRRKRESVGNGLGF